MDKFTKGILTVIAVGIIGLNVQMMNDGGFIEIDSLDISKVELSTLRKKITMIPQDPTLFAGPLRYSLDP